MVPEGTPIATIGYVRDLKLHGFYSDIDISPGGSGGPNIAWVGTGTNRRLAVKGVTLKTGASSLNGNPYRDSVNPDDRSMTFSLYFTEPLLRTAEDLSRSFSDEPNVARPTSAELPNNKPSQGLQI